MKEMHAKRWDGHLQKKMNRIYYPNLNVHLPAWEVTSAKEQQSGQLPQLPTLTCNCKKLGLDLDLGQSQGQFCPQVSVMTELRVANFEFP